MWGSTWARPTSRSPSMMKTWLWPRGRAFPCATSARARAWNLMPTPTSRACSTCSGARLRPAARAPLPRWRLTGQAESLVALGEDMRPVMNAISWMDERSTEECALLAEAFPERRVEEVTARWGCCPPGPPARFSGCAASPGTVCRRPQIRAHQGLCGLPPHRPPLRRLFRRHVHALFRYL